MAGAGDGTGTETIREQQGLQFVEGQEPEGAGESGGSGAQLEPKGNRTSPKK